GSVRASPLRAAAVGAAAVGATAVGATAVGAGLAPEPGHHLASQLGGAQDLGVLEEPQNPRAEGGGVGHLEGDHHGAVVPSLADGVLAQLGLDPRGPGPVDEHLGPQGLALPQLPGLVGQRGPQVEAGGNGVAVRLTPLHPALDAVDAEGALLVVIPVAAQQVPEPVAEAQAVGVDPPLPSPVAEAHRGPRAL